MTFRLEALFPRWLAALAACAACAFPAAAAPDTAPDVLVRKSIDEVLAVTMGDSE